MKIIPILLLVCGLMITSRHGQAQAYLNPFQPGYEAASKAHQDSVKQGLLYEPVPGDYLIQTIENSQEQTLRLDISPRRQLTADSILVQIGGGIIRHALLPISNRGTTYSVTLPTYLPLGHGDILVTLKRGKRQQATYQLWKRSAATTNLWYSNITKRVK